MELLSTLVEASGHAIDDLKKVISKDKRISSILLKHSDLESISNPAEFLNTLKFFVLNNVNVLQFVEGRDYVNALSKRELKKLRELKSTELTQKTLDDLREFIHALFREHSHVERTGLTPRTRKEIAEWMNNSGRYYDLTGAARKELESIPGIRPTRPVLLYRGLLFNSSSLKERKRYDGQLEVGDGLKFLRSVREGSRIVDLSWDRASSWSTSKEIASRFAQFGPASSNFEATLNWLSNADKGKIHGDLGFIVSTLVQPEDVLIDISRLITTAHMKHGGEGEMILKPGEYTCRISTKFDKTGEIDPISSGTVDEAVSKAVSDVKEFANDWKFPEIKGLEADDWGTYSIDRLLMRKEIEGLISLTKSAVKSASTEAFGALQAFYKRSLEHLTAGQLETLQADPRIGKIVEWMTAVRKGMADTRNHSAHKTSSNSRGRTKIADLTPEQFRETSYGILDDRLKAASTGGRFTDYSTGRAIEDLLKALTGDSVKDLHRKGRKDQEEVMDRILAGFYKSFGLEQPADREQAIKTMRNAFLAADRNAMMLNTLKGYYDPLIEATKGSTS